MFFFKSKRSREVETFAVELAREIGGRCKPEAAYEADRISMALAHAIDDACRRATEFQREKRLGMYHRAALGTAFKFELKDLGYDKQLVDGLTRQLLLKISAA